MASSFTGHLTSMNALARFVATGAYTGYAPFAPGTFGTLPAVALAPALAALLPSRPVVYVAVVLAAIAIAVWAADRVAHVDGIKDPQIVVVDEIVGYFIAMAFLPATITTLLAAFVLFRLFDIVKPPPARQAEALPGGIGVVADDLVAGLFANLVLRLAVMCGLL